MRLFLRFFFFFLVLFLGPAAWLNRNGWEVQRVVPPSSITERGGYAYAAIVPLLPLTDRLTDGEPRGDVSDLRLFEDNKELGPNHTPPAKIESDGHGAFDDWGGALVISSLDNGDPRKSGRVLTARYRAYPVAEAPVVFLAVIVAAALIATGVVTVRRTWSTRKTWTVSAKRLAAVPIAAIVVMTAAMVLHLHGVKIRSLVPSTEMSSFGSYAYSARVPTPIPFLSARGDDLQEGPHSGLVLREDGRPIGPPHTGHDNIRARGGGAYSHWGNSIVFSASDNSDPRVNSRGYGLTYKVFLARSATWLIVGLGFGIILLAGFVHLSRMWARSITRFIHGLRDAAVHRRRDTTPLAASKSLLYLARDVAIYTLALLFLYGSLEARKNDPGGLKINFEYKVF